jgi:hypothetical protein
MACNCSAAGAGMGAALAADLAGSMAAASGSMARQTVHWLSGAAAYTAYVSLHTPSDLVGHARSSGQPLMKSRQGWLTPVAVAVSRPATDALLPNPAAAAARCSCGHCNCCRQPLSPPPPRALSVTVYILPRSSGHAARHMHTHSGRRCPSDHLCPSLLPRRTPPPCQTARSPSSPQQSPPLVCP